MLSGDEIKNNISKNIVKYREKAKLSQKELAKKLNTTSSRVSNWEQGSNCPTIDILFEVCKVLDVSINDIYGVYPDSELILSYNEQDHIKKYRFVTEYSPDGAKMIDAILNREHDIAKQLSTQNDYIKRLEAKLIPTRMISYYQKLASAGKGEYLFDGIPTDLIEVADTEIAQQADFVLGVNGRSMEPTYYDGEKVFVKKMAEIHTGDIGVFTKGNDCYIKELGIDRLISHNKNKVKYPDISANEDIILVGKVLGKVIE